MRGRLGEREDEWGGVRVREVEGGKGNELSHL